MKFEPKIFETDRGEYAKVLIDENAVRLLVQNRYIDSASIDMTISEARSLAEMLERAAKFLEGKE